MVNQSKANDARFWKLWEDNGAIGTYYDALFRENVSKLSASKAGKEIVKDVLGYGVEDLKNLGVSSRAASQVSKALLFQNPNDKHAMMFRGGMNDIPKEAYCPSNLPRLAYDIGVEIGRLDIGMDHGAGMFRYMAPQQILALLPDRFPEGYEGAFFQTDEKGRLNLRTPAYRAMNRGINLDLRNLGETSDTELSELAKTVRDLTSRVVRDKNRSIDSFISGYDACDVTLLTDKSTYERLNGFSLGNSKDMDTFVDRNRNIGMVLGVEDQDGKRYTSAKDIPGFEEGTSYAKIHWVAYDNRSFREPSRSYFERLDGLKTQPSFAGNFAEIVANVMRRSA